MESLAWCIPPPLGPLALCALPLPRPATSSRPAAPRQTRREAESAARVIRAFIGLGGDRGQQENTGTHPLGACHQGNQGGGLPRAWDAAPHHASARRDWWMTQQRIARVRSVGARVGGGASRDFPRVKASQHPCAGKGEPKPWTSVIQRKTSARRQAHAQGHQHPRRTHRNIGGGPR